MKKIRKTYSGVVPNGKVLNSRNNSQQDTYSSDYLNRAIPDTKDLGEIIVDDITCKNIFDGKLELGAINSYGANFSDSNSIRSVNFINVKPDTVYTQSNVNNYKTIIFFYDSSKRFISNVGNNLSTNTFTTPSNCAYVRFCTYVSEGATDTTSKFQVELGKVATNYVEHKEFSNKCIKEDVTSKLTGNGVTIVSAKKYKFGNFVNYQVVFSANSSISNATDLITGFEKPMLNYSGIVCFPIFNNNSQNIIHGILSENASLRNYGSISSGQSCRCNIVYTTSD